MGDYIFKTTGSQLTTYPCTFEDDKRPRHEKFFNMTEDEIYKEYGLVFTKTNICIGNEMQYRISSDFEAELWMIKKGFLKYVRGVKVWHDEAFENGWENAWTPPENYKTNKKSKNLGHVYFFKSANSYKVGCSCENNIKNRVRQQLPDEVLAVSKARNDYKKLEKKIHKMFAKNRVARYEIFNDLTEDEVEKIKKMLGNTIAVEIKLRGEK